MPRLYELLHSRITSQIEKESRIKRFLFGATIRLGQKSQLSVLERVLDGLCERLVRHKVRQRFGGKLRYFVSGGAALNPKISEFFQGLGVGILTARLGLKAMTLLRPLPWYPERQVKLGTIRKEVVAKVASITMKP